MVVRRDIPFPGADTGVSAPMGSLLALRPPNAPAVTADNATTSYGELEARCNRRARALAALGVGQDDLVIVSLPNGLEYFETTFAIWKLGATVCHVNARLPDKEMSAIVELARPKLIAGCAPAGWDGAHSPAGFGFGETFSADPLEPRVAKHWKVSTSGGSTGRPKLIVDQAPSRWTPSVGALGQKPGDVTVNAAPLYHNAPFGLMHILLFTGGHVVEMARFDPCRLLELIEEWRATWLYLVPTMMHRIWRLPPEKRRRDLSSLELVIHMAAACPVWLKERWIEWLGPDVIWELYGGTETIGATLISGREWLERKGSVGRLWMGQDLKAFNAAGKACSPGEIGEIFFKVGAAAPYEYIGAQARRRGEWQSFGDMGHLDADGYLYIADRRTDMIVTGGANVYPAEIEAALDAHADVASSAVIGLPDDDLGQRIHALVEPAAGAQANAHALAEFLATQVAAHKIPRSFEFVTEALRDEAGKVRRGALREARVCGPRRD